jgi:transketolase
MIRKSLFEKSQVLNSTRNGFGLGLLRAGANNDVWVITADLKGSTSISNFKEKFPERFIQTGVSEQNLVTVASGVASFGKVVFATSFAAFSPGRNWEQIRTTICYNDVPVVVVGSHTGLGVGEDGATHQALEDIALMRSLPNMRVVVPCDAIQAERATLALANLKSPAYLRLTRQKSPLITTASTPFKLGSAQVFKDGVDLVIFSCGPIIFEALKAAKELEKNKIKVAVVNVHTIKPLDEKLVIKYAKKCGAFMTLEDHQVAGGLGSAISECLSKNYPTLGDFIGMDDEFGESGPFKELYWKYGLTHDRIATRVKKLFLAKNKSKKSVIKNKSKKINKGSISKVKSSSIKKSKKIIGANSKKVVKKSSKIKK